MSERGKKGGGRREKHKLWVFPFEGEGRWDKGSIKPILKRERMKKRGRGRGRERVSRERRIEEEKKKITL